MFASLLGIRLLVWMGRTIPAPPPPGLLDTLGEVEVTNDARSGDGFRLTFTVTKGLLDYDAITAGALEPMTRVVIAAVMGVVPEVLIDGVITHQQLAPSQEPGASTLTVMGHDLRTALDLTERNAKYENQPDFIIFNQLIARYPQFGLVPVAMPTTSIPIMLQRTPRQAETDLAFIERMAQRNGYVFYIEPVTVGVNTAYFGPPSRVGLPQPALTMNMGADSNLKSLSFSNDALAPTGVEGTFVEPFTRTALPIPPLPSLRVPPLASSAAAPLRTRLARDAAHQGPTDAALTALAASMNAADPVRGQGELDGVRYGSVLRARRLVGVRGAGFAHNGNYYVERVTHLIRRGSYTQQFSLSREGTGALLPVVRP
ncbi:MULTISPECIES: phage late control D family protein [Sorangium]|uniref:Phage protein D n=1 Tax=Sorangium cellulosum (strain So ce56) TaxID=448385 RepID=A9FVA2_SORC5|nr:hypothetical protein [Sorangium cellulosum]CAN92253.1 hypothetical protein sce2094 [Sorangium cellulosum So ce56]